MSLEACTSRVYQFLLAVSYVPEKGPLLPIYLLDLHLKLPE